MDGFAECGGECGHCTRPDVLHGVRGRLLLLWPHDGRCLELTERPRPVASMAEAVELWRRVRRSCSEKING